MKGNIQDRYSRLASNVGLDKNDCAGTESSRIIRKALHGFVNACNNPAIWCMGQHTRMLMSDFMNELKSVKFIIDNAVKIQNSGFQIITQDEMVQNCVDGIIISTYEYREEIKEVIHMKFPQIPYLDIYDELERHGVILQSSYYTAGHPYSKYKVLNRLQRDLRQESCEKNIEVILKAIVKEYIAIKDFKTAMSYAERLAEKEILKEIKEIYQEEKWLLSSIAKNNVLMFCVDGLRRGDVLGGKMPGLLQWLKERTYFYENAYAVSTSTYESLIPTYMENNDLRTEYYKKSQIPKEKCRFILEALKQDRKIFFYTDTDEYIDCEKIERSGHSQTATEKLWDFAMDAVGVDNGLFYLHILYESHYSYPNPYTIKELVADGTNIMFDYLDSLGGGLRTDYAIQQRDALAYLDSVVTPLLQLINCKIAFFADHGNILLHRQDTLYSIEETKWTFHRDLIEIPMAIKAPEIEAGSNKAIISLMELPSIVSCLMNGKKYEYTEKRYIKVVRSRIYNPDFIFLYHKSGHERGLQSFELFLYADGCRLAVYEDGTTEVYLGENKQNDEELCRRLYNEVKNQITVCELHFVEEKLL